MRFAELAGSSLTFSIYNTSQYQAVRTSEPEGFESVQVRSFAKLVRPEEMKKLLPMGIMLFCGTKARIIRFLVR